LKTETLEYADGEKNVNVRRHAAKKNGKMDSQSYRCQLNWGSPHHTSLQDPTLRASPQGMRRNHRQIHFLFLYRNRVHDPLRRSHAENFQT
jgi:hypothetical protein